MLLRVQHLSQELKSDRDSVNMFKTKAAEFLSMSKCCKQHLLFLNDKMAK